jgi:two-component system, OmpR family, phosphate regulon sensor histidine kinase PhoR
MGVRVNRLILYFVSIAFIALLSTQVYWFLQTSKLEEKQFDATVNLSLRAVADQILKINGDNKSAIPPVRQLTSNSFYVDTATPLRYAILDSLIRSAFKDNGIRSPFQLMLYDGKNEILLGHNYTNAETSKNTACLGREPAGIATSFSVAFPERTSDMLGSANLWIFSAGSGMLIFILSFFVIRDFSRERKLATMKNEFISNMTHELQTPITNISMAGQVLRVNPSLADEKRKKYLDIILEENLRLKSNVEQVLKTAALETTDLVLQRKTIDLNALIEKVTERFRMRIDHRQGAITTELQADSPFVEGDESHLENVFYNLLDNAEKYSPEQVRIHITSENSEDRIVIKVTDHGIGMTTTTQQLIFDRFFRATNGNIHDVKGFGLGLSYVKKIIEAHRGGITVQSTVNEGSSFYISLPKLKYA